MNRTDIFKIGLELGAKPGAMHNWTTLDVLPAKWQIAIARRKKVSIAKVIAAWEKT